MSVTDRVSPSTQPPAPKRRRRSTSHASAPTSRSAPRPEHRPAARLPRQRRERHEAARQVLDSLRDTYETAYANVHRGVYAHAAAATANFEGTREKVRALLNAAQPARGHLHARHDRGDQPRRLLAGAARTSRRRHRRHHRAGASLQPRAVATGMRSAPAPSCASSRSTTTACWTSRGLDALAAGGRLRIVAVVARLQLARHDHPARRRGALGQVARRAHPASTAPRACRTRPSTCRRSASTSSPSPATS